MDFYAEDAIRLSPYKDDKLKYAENTPFWAGSDYSRLPMHGWICDDRNIDESWLVNFPQCGEKDDIAEIPVKEEDLRPIEIMYAKVNEEIAERYKQTEK